MRSITQSSINTYTYNNYETTLSHWHLMRSLRHWRYLKTALFRIHDTHSPNTISYLSSPPRVCHYHLVERALGCGNPSLPALYPITKHFRVLGNAGQFGTAGRGSRVIERLILRTTPLSSRVQLQLSR